MQIGFIIWEYFINFLEVFFFYTFIHTKLNLKNFKYITINEQI